MDVTVVNDPIGIVVVLLVVAFIANVIVGKATGKSLLQRLKDRTK